MAAKTNLLLANRPSEGKTGRMWVTGFDASFDESALTISILPKF
jgi:hypothetical protein